MLFDDIQTEQVAQRLKLIRQAHGLRASELCDDLKISRVYWSRYENGHRLIAPEHAVRLAHRFGVTLDYVYCGLMGALPFELCQRLRGRPVQQVSDAA